MKICIYLPFLFLFFVYSIYYYSRISCEHVLVRVIEDNGTRLKPVVTTRSKKGESIQTCLTDSSSLVGPFSLLTTISYQI